MANQSIIGIDLGTTQSCVSVWLSGWERVEVISNDQGKRTTPSCVAFTDGERLIGDPALGQISRNPWNTISQVKRLMGREFDDEVLQKQLKLLPYKVVKTANGKPQIAAQWKGEEKRFWAEEISAMILTKMKEVAEAKLGKGTVKKAVITVPAYFNNLQRQATKDAGEIAGLEVVRIINEPTAAAFAYGFDESVNKGQGIRNILVFDLGGGTFDVSILEINGKNFTVKGTGGNTNLGGEDFDDALVEFCVDNFKQKYGKDIKQNIRAVRKLRTQCEKAKCDLSYQTRSQIDIDSFYDGIDYSVTISRARLNNLLEPFFKQCLDIVKEVIQNAAMTQKDIEKVLLVGGSSRIPRVQELLTELFEGDKICKSINPDEAVAYGAAVQGAILSGTNCNAIRDIVVQDIIPLTIGVEVIGDLMLPVIPKNTPLPCSKKETLHTVKDNQTFVRMDIYQGERPLINENQLLGKFHLSGIQPAPKGQSKIRLKYSVDSNGILKVTAYEINNKSNNNATSLTPEQLTLSAYEIEKMINDAEKYRQQDEEDRQRIVKKLELSDQLYYLESKIKYISNKSLKGVAKYTLESVQEWLDMNQNATKKQYEEKISQITKIIIMKDK